MEQAYSNDLRSKLLQAYAKEKLGLKNTPVRSTRFKRSIFPTPPASAG